MENVIFEKGSKKLPIKAWLPNVDYKTLDQAINVSKLPFAYKHVALMPDAHCGYGMPIGCIFAAENVIIPNAVGKDIGCGMLAVQTSLTDIDIDTLKKIVAKIKRSVPVGMNHHKTPKHADMMPAMNEFCSWLDIVESQMHRLPNQIGTLGGGNHFIEIQKGDDGYIWFMIHTGSRNIGSRVADHYDKLAQKLNAQWFSSVPKEHQLAFLPLDTQEAKNYINEMHYCLDFANSNRYAISMDVVDVIDEFFPGTEFSAPINLSHNFAAMENHFGKNVMVHRKGATHAKKGQKGIIPGSMGTKSYIVEGLGNKESFMSCSHGAGRALGRKKAQETLDLSTEQNIMDTQNIVHSMTKIENLEEAPSAYKPIGEVMNNQKDLVKILVELQPLAVIKG